MRDVDSSIENLRRAAENGVEHFCFYLEDSVPFNPSYFYWYSSQNDLHKALIEDLWAMLFEHGDKEEVEVFIDEVQQIVDELKFKKTPVFLEMTKRIQDVWNEFENSSTLNFIYIGTYDLLCKGTSEFERQIRNVYRYGKDERANHKGQPIGEHEIDDFNEFISSEI